MHAYSTAVIIKRLQKHLPTTAQEVLDYCELPLLYIGGGAFRDAYLIVGTDFVLKIPRKVRIHKKTEANIQHARDEYAIWQRIRKSKQKFLSLKRYLPTLYYYNSATGVIVVKKYEKMKYSKEATALIRDLEKTITDTLDTKEADIHYGNLGVDKDGSIKIIDMGLFLAGKV